MLLKRVLVANVGAVPVKKNRGVGAAPSGVSVCVSVGGDFCLSISGCLITAICGACIYDVLCGVCTQRGVIISATTTVRKGSQSG